MNLLVKVKNIWERPPEGVGNAVKSAIFAERAKVVLREIIDTKPTHPALLAGKVSRRYLEKRVGCSYPTLTQNLDIRGQLAVADQIAANRIASSGTSVSELAQELKSHFLPEEPQSIFRSNSRFSKIVLTNEDFQFAGEPHPGVPTILFADGIDEASADWLRHIATEDGVLPGTALQYAKILRPYLAYCREQKRSWDSADDGWLLTWRANLLGARQVQRLHANYCLGVIFAFYLHSEASGSLRYRVGFYDKEQLPAPLQNVKLPISAMRIYSGQSQKRLSWTSPLLFRNVESSIGNRGTPTDEEIEAAHREALKGRNGSRDTLLMSWAEDTGGRRAELLQLKVSQIPEPSEIDHLAETPDSWCAIEVIRKGRNPGLLKAQPDTLYATVAYLRIRRTVVAKCLKRNPSYKEPAELFISSTTGRPLQPNSVTAALKKYFRRIGVNSVNIHRIRAKFAKDCVETVLDAFLEAGIQFSPGSNWIETVLQQVAHRMGHKNPSSLRHYLTVALERRIRLSEAAVEDLRRKQDRNARLATEAALARCELVRRLLADLDTSPGPHQKAARLREYALELESKAKP